MPVRIGCSYLECYCIEKDSKATSTLSKGKYDLLVTSVLGMGIGSDMPDIYYPCTRDTELLWPALPPENFS